jgi:hypothetical protein
VWYRDEKKVWYRDVAYKTWSVGWLQFCSGSGGLDFVSESKKFGVSESLDQSLPQTGGEDREREGTEAITGIG